MKDPANQMPRFWSISNWRATKVEIAPTTEPSMMPMMGTISDDFRVTRRRKGKKTIVPMKENMIATIIRVMMEASG